MRRLESRQDCEAYARDFIWDEGLLEDPEWAADVVMEDLKRRDVAKEWRAVLRQELVESAERHNERGTLT
jgi:hypothetical protein